MSPAEQRAQGERMRKMAVKAKDSGVRESYLKMAQDWDQLAKDAEELQRRLDAEKRLPPGRG